MVCGAELEDRESRDEHKDVRPLVLTSNSGFPKIVIKKILSRGVPFRYIADNKNTTADAVAVSGRVTQ
jgi:hypothetical protein